MNIIFSIYHTVLFQPLFNILILLYNFIPGKDFGIAIIVLTILLRAAFYPLSAKAFVAQKVFAELQPKLKELREKFKHDKDALARQTLEAYQKSGVNPFASIGPLLLQLPILLAIFQVFSKGLQESQLSILYPFVRNPETISPLFLGIVNLSEQSLVLAVIAGALQFLQMHIGMSSSGSASKNSGAALAQKHIMPIFFSAFTVSILLRLPAAIGIYWVATSVFSIAQQWYLAKKMKTREATLKLA
ncbi:MAG: YidC/Oxa1 family membrane protein insertase [Candidatus Wildermuthbacteria bacterium]|nr:YidC/Oxa1 family membrane protein insertase [Candidatus Wildermuthbacteria bacterium]